MFKAVGGLIIISVFSIFGFSVCRALSRRCTSLEEFRRLFLLLKNEISLRATPLDKAFSKIGQDNNNLCFTLCSQKLPSIGANAALSYALEETEKIYMLKTEDIKILKSAAVCLGKCDLKNQLRQLDYVLSLLDISIAEAKRERAEKSRLFMNGAVLTGITLTLMLV